MGLAPNILPYPLLKAHIVLLNISVFAARPTNDVFRDENFRKIRVYLIFPYQKKRRHSSEKEKKKGNQENTVDEVILWEDYATWQTEINRGIARTFRDLDIPKKRVIGANEQGIKLRNWG